MSVSSKFHTSYNVVIIFTYVVVSNVTDDLDDVFSCNSSSLSHNVGQSVGLSVNLTVCRSVHNEFDRSVMLLLVYICCY